MRRNSRAVVVSSGMIVLSVAGGCQPPTIPATIGLSPAIGSFVLEAGTAVMHAGTVNFNNDSGLTIGSGRLRLDPSVITFTPAAGKFTAFQVVAETLTVTARVGPPEDVATVCETGETYGPFTVTLDENLQPASIEPDSVGLSQTTIDLLNAGSFSLCLEAVSSVNGTLAIPNMVFDLGL